MSSPDSTSIMLSPISPSPPRGIRRTQGSTGASMGTGSGRYGVLTAAPLSYHPGSGGPRNRRGPGGAPGVRATGPVTRESSRLLARLWTLAGTSRAGRSGHGSDVGLARRLRERNQRGQVKHHGGVRHDLGGEVSDRPSADAADPSP